MTCRCWSTTGPLSKTASLWHSTWRSWPERHGQQKFSQGWSPCECRFMSQETQGGASRCNIWFWCSVCVVRTLKRTGSIFVSPKIWLYPCSVHDAKSVGRVLMPPYHLEEGSLTGVCPCVQCLPILSGGGSCGGVGGLDVRLISTQTHLFRRSSHFYFLCFSYSMRITRPTIGSKYSRMSKKPSRHETPCSSSQLFEIQ